MKMQVQRNHCVDSTLSFAFALRTEPGAAAACSMRVADAMKGSSFDWRTGARGQLATTPPRETSKPVTVLRTERLSFRLRPPRWECLELCMMRRQLHWSRLLTGLPV
jgi:hypothetical protein